MTNGGKRANSFFTLHGRETSIVLEPRADAAPLWRYWGPRLPDGAGPTWDLGSARPTPSFALDVDQPLSVFPTFGAGWFYQSALLSHRGGRDFTQSTNVAQIAKTPNGLLIHLEDAVAELAIDLALTLDPVSDVLCMKAALTNRASEPLDVQSLAAATLPLPPEATRVRYYAGRHNREFEEHDEALPRALWRRENRRGLTSHDLFPGALALTSGAGRDEGLVYGAQIAWSGNHVQTIERLDDGRRCWHLGEWLAPGEAQLKTGDTLQTPDVLATCSVSGTNGVAQNFHRAVRSRMSWPGGAMRARPVHLNTWEAFYFNHRIDELKSLAQEAAHLGVERFVLDDGWFNGRDHDAKGLGDWVADKTKFPDGLRPLADFVVGLGMQFGLWVEPEMANPDSDLFRANPDWVLKVDGRPLLTGRNQLVLDLTRREVAAHIFNAIAALLSRLPISYLKWDHNRDLTLAADARGHAAYRGQVSATYALLARLRAAFPAIEIEACAGGGGRIDAGIIQYTHRFWTSDCLDAVTRLSIQRGFLQFMPPELMGSHVGAATAHATGRTHPMELRAGVAATGHFGVELDIRALDPNERLALQEWMTFYKAHRVLIHGGEVWLGEAGDGIVWQAHGTSSDILLFVYRIEPAIERYAPLLRLPMLEKSRPYRVMLAAGWRRRGWMKGGQYFDAIAESGVVEDGAWLAASGLPAPPMLADSVAVYRLTAL